MTFLTCLVFLRKSLGIFLRKSLGIFLRKSLGIFLRVHSFPINVDIMYI